MPTIEDTLKERGRTHGDFRNNAEISQALKLVFRDSSNWESGGLPVYVEEALDAIATKIARILSGNPLEPDHWHDISGYAALAKRETEKIAPPSSRGDPK